MQTESIMEVENLCKNFGGVRALDGISFKMPAGTMFGIIGPNGSGKTTLFNTISGVIKASGGKVSFAGQDITNKPPHYIARLGISRTFQHPRIFAGLSVRDNVAAGLVEGSCPGTLRKMIGNVRKAACYADDLLELFGLASQRDVAAVSLPYGEQQLMSIARALASKPKLLLLDEPVAGMNPLESQELVSLLGRVKDELGVSIALIEHNMAVVMSSCDPIVVLNYGKNIAEGPAHSLRKDPIVISAYLGEEV